MLFKVLAVAGWVAVSVISSASAQNLSGPAETPPSSFKGAQYVDSRGCVFLRAGIGGRVNWVPRISRDRKALCSQSPAAAAREVVAATSAPRATRPSASTARKPMETIASLPRPAPAVIPKSATVRLQNGCPAASPYGARVTLTDGRRSLICSADPGFDVRAAADRAQVARSMPPPATQPAPQYQAKAVAAGSGYKCPASAPVARRYAIRGGGSTVMCTAVNGGLESARPPLALGEQAEFIVPKGYKKAWKDGRLNTNRGKGTALGQAMQDQVWTRDIPAQLVANGNVAPTAKRKAYTTSTSNAPRKAETGRYYVQIGTFGAAANATRSAARLQGLGLPVAKARITSKGRNLQIVMAGPFGDAAAAKAALSSARRAGFGDAFIR